MGLQLQGSLQVTALLDAEVEAVMRKLDVADLLPRDAAARAAGRDAMRTVLRQHFAPLKLIFRHYCSAHFARRQSASQTGGAGGAGALPPPHASFAMGAAEWEVFLSDSGAVNAKLSHGMCGVIFVRCNWERDLSTGDKAPDEDNPDTELLLHEWLAGLCRLAHARAPPARLTRHEARVNKHTLAASLGHVAPGKENGVGGVQPPPPLQRQQLPPPPLQR